MANFRTHRGANNPPFFKGFPMSLIGYFLACFILSSIFSSILFGLFFNYIFTMVLTLCTTAAVCYKAFQFLKELGPFGMNKAYIKYLKAVDKMQLKRPNIDTIHIFPKTRSWK
jgi:hypothetical protein